MSQSTAAPTRLSGTPTSARLLVGGVLAGPLFLSSWAVQASLRTGFDPTVHPLSLLARGDLGWVQVATFVATGSLFIASSRGLREALPDGRGSRWVPRLVRAMGAGFVAAGIFVTDAGAGSPPGAPAGAPQMSWHGALHEVGFMVTVLSWTAACIVLARRFKARQQRRWLAASVAAPLAAFVVATWPDLDTLSVRLVVSTAIQLGYMSALSAHLRRNLPAAAATRAPQRTPVPAG